MAIVPTEKSDAVWAKRSVLVTGGAGFLGSWLTHELLTRGAAVTVLDIEASMRSLGEEEDHVLAHTRFVQGSVCDIAKVEEVLAGHDIDTVMHLAAKPIVEDTLTVPAQTLDTNIRGTWTVLDACRNRKDIVRRIVVASTDKAYGTHAVLPYTEDCELNGNGHPYDCSKGCADRIARMYGSVYGMPIVVTRCANIFGGGDTHFSRIVPGTIKSILSGEPPVLRSDGTYLRDYIYVKDAVRAYLACADGIDAGVRNAAFNFGNNMPVTVIELTKTIAALMGRGNVEPVIRNTAQKEIHDQYLDSQRARSRLSWTPHYTQEQALLETIAWYTMHLRRA